MHGKENKIFNFNYNFMKYILASKSPYRCLYSMLENCDLKTAMYRLYDFLQRNQPFLLMDH